MSPSQIDALLAKHRADSKELTDASKSCGSEAACTQLADQLKENRDFFQNMANAFSGTDKARAALYSNEATASQADRLIALNRQGEFASGRVPAACVTIECAAGLNRSSVDYLAVSGTFLNFGGSVAVNIHNGDVLFSPSLVKPGIYGGGESPKPVFSFTVGSIVGGGNSQPGFTTDFLRGASSQVSVGTLGGVMNVTSSYGGATATELGIGSPGVSYTPISYGFDAFNLKGVFKNSTGSNR